MEKAKHSRPRTFLEKQNFNDEMGQARPNNNLPFKAPRKKTFQSKNSRLNKESASNKNKQRKLGNIFSLKCLLRDLFLEKHNIPLFRLSSGYCRGPVLVPKIIDLFAPRYILDTIPISHNIPISQYPFSLLTPSQTQITKLTKDSSKSKKSKLKNSEDVSHICNKRISEPSSSEDEGDEGLFELTGEIQKMQLQDQAQDIFEDVEELFETFSRKEDTQYAQMGKPQHGRKNRPELKQPTFTDMSIIQTTNSEFMKISKK